MNIIGGYVTAGGNCRIFLTDALGKHHQMVVSNVTGAFNIMNSVPNMTDEEFLESERKAQELREANRILAKV